MRLWLLSVVAIFLIVSPLFVGQAALQTSPTVTPSPPVPPPSATAPAFTPPPSPTPTMTPVVSMPKLPALEKITADNINQLRPLFSLQCHEPTANLSGVGGIRNLLWSPVHNLLVVFVHSGMCHYDFDQNVHEGWFIETYDIQSAVFSPDGETLATLHNGNKSVRLWDTQTWDEIPTTLVAGYNIRRTNPTLAYSPDGKFIATVSYRGGLRLYDAQTEVLLVRARVPSWAVYFNGDGSRLVTVNTDGIGLWTVYDGPKLFQDQVLPIGNQDTRDISVMMWGADRNRFYYSLHTDYFAYDLAEDTAIDPPAFLNGNGFMLLPDGVPVELFANNPFRFLSPAFTNMDDSGFSPDGKLLATIPVGGTDIIQLWGLPMEP